MRDARLHGAQTAARRGGGKHQVRLKFARFETVIHGVYYRTETLSNDSREVILMDPRRSTVFRLS
jgi:hypothetical protein